jgi:zinc/manganese transport system substrate-binding protein
MFWRRFLHLSACLVALAVSAAAAPLRVVTLSTVLTEVAATVGGSDASVTGLLTPGVDPHTFEPAPSDMRSVTEADLVLASGLGIEPYLDKLIANSGTRARVVEAGSVLQNEAIYAEIGGRREADPHWWNSIQAMKRVTNFVALQMARLRPEYAAEFRERAGEYAARLDELDAWARLRLAGLPRSKRQLVTTHDAFAWFARDYGFTIHPISGVSTEDEPDARELAHLVELIRQERIPAVFIEDSENSKLAAALARETGASLGGTLYPDGLVPAADGSTYSLLFRHNLDTIVEALRP